MQPTKGLLTGNHGPIPGKTRLLFRLFTGHCARHCCAVSAAAHGGYSSTIETCPIAGSVADATLLYAVMANISYPTSSMPDISSNKALPKLAAAAAAEAAKQPPRPLSLPR